MRILSLVVAILTFVPLSHAQGAPPSAEGVEERIREANTVVAFEVRTVMPGTTDALSLPVLDDLAGENHLVQLEVIPDEGAYEVMARFEFNGMSAFRSWYNAEATRKLFATLEEAKITHHRVAYSLKVARTPALARQG